MSQGGKAGPLFFSAGKQTEVQEVRTRRHGHVTAAAAEKHVGADGGVGMRDF